MEHVRKILKQTQTNILKVNMDTLSDVEGETDLETSCSICGGAKFVHPLLNTGKPDYSQVVPCICTRQEIDAERKAQLQRYSNLGKLINISFDSLNQAGVRDNSSDQERYEKAFRAAKNFAEKPQGWLVFTGPSGCGKTYLAAAIASYQIEKNDHAFYITTPDLLDHIRSSFNSNNDIPYDELFEQVKNTPLLILDDLGAQSNTPWAKEKLEQLVSHRYSNQIPTVIVVIGAVDEMDERIYTRLINSPLHQVCSFNSKSPLLVYEWQQQYKLQKDMTFENFELRQDLPEDQQENLEKILTMSRAYAENPMGWFVLLGVNGCGKTHLAAAIVNYRYQQKQPAMFIVVPDFLDHLRSTFSPESRISYDQLFESVKGSPLLILDDFGRQTTTPWAQEKLYQVVNYRYNARLPMVVTTNSSLDELDTPIASRLTDPDISAVENIIAPDYRPRIKYKSS